MRELRIQAYCTVPACRAVAEATGVAPLVSPPVTAETLDPAWLEGYDLLYFRLHGLENSDNWFGESKWGTPVLALTPEMLWGVDLSGTVVVVANCYGAQSPRMIGELYTAGARAVVAGRGPNYAAGRRVIGADKLVREMAKGLRRGWSPSRALYVARLKLLTTAWRAADRDALEFSIIERGGLT